MSTLLMGQVLMNEVNLPDGTVSRTPGGSMLNVGLGLKRLGRSVRIVTDLGRDADGAIIAEYAASNGIELWLRADEELTDPTSSMRVSIDSSGSVTHRHSVTWDIQGTPESPACRLDLELLDPHSLAYDLASCRIEPGATKVSTWVDVLHDRCTTFFNVNARPSYLGDRSRLAATVEEMAPYADIVKTSTDDISIIYGDRATMTDVADLWRAQGASLVVVTCGAAGAYVFSTNDEPIRILPIEAKRVDSTGAGDAFFAALIDGVTRLSLSGPHKDHLRNASPALLQTLGAYASTAASITVTRSGVNPPTREEMAAVNDAYRVDA